MRMRFLAVQAATVVLALKGCGPSGAGDPAPVVAMFDLESGSLFDVPFPSEIRRTSSGEIDVTLFPNPRGILMVEEIKSAIMEGTDGFGLNTAAYLRFSGPIDTGTLPPTPGMSSVPGSTIQMIVVDPSSPYVGERVPVQWLWRETMSDFWSPDTLAVLPVPGFVLRPDTLYAVALLDGIMDAEGRPVERDEGFVKMIDDVTDFGSGYSAAETAYRQAMQALVDAGAEEDGVVTAAVFRTGDPAAGMERLYDAVTVHADAPELLDIALETDEDGYAIYTGHYSGNPIYQDGFGEGLSPYESEGGEILFDGFGDPILSGEETMRVAVTVPDGMLPPGGWPVILYAHGTGGDYLSFTRDGTAGILAARGMAVISIDNSMNGARIPDGASPETLFFNVGNIRAARDNVRQGAVDVIQLERLVPVLEIGPEVTPDGSTVTFDSSRMGYMGHSQGGLNGAPYLAVSRRCEAAYLSGAGGGLLYSLVYKTEPIRIRNIMGLVMGFTGAGDELDAEDFGIFHPTLNLAQLYFEPADGVNYARYWFDEPLDGVPAKSVLMSEGMNDSYAPPETIEALAASGFLPQVMPVLRVVPGIDLAGLTELSPPVTGNAAMGLATVGLVQYPENPDYDGHFVAFHDAGAIETWGGFLGAVAAGTMPVIDTR